MTIEEQVSKGLEIIGNQRQELGEIIKQAAETGETIAGFERLKRWKGRTIRLLADEVHPGEAKKLSNKRKSSVIMGQPLRNLVDEAGMYDSFLTALAEELEKHPEDVIAIPIPASKTAIEVEAPSPESTNAVFVIHGHDELNLLRLKEFLRERWGLEPVVMFGEPGRGRTLIEKFEDEAQRSSFALALMTPDDLIQVGDGTYAQARPNVIFELGWFYGRLGRERVCILFKEGTRLHSDLDGISRIEFQDDVRKKIGEIEKELLAAGILTD
ncbi:MAG: nucleotide-binding protein [Chloroflexota bacterium]|nr:nucleotide-binding protein [Chloroflexota bacterium]